MHAEGVDEPWPIPCAIEDGKPFFAWISAMDTMDIVLRPLFGESRDVSGYISLLMVDGMIRWMSCYCGIMSANSKMIIIIPIMIIMIRTNQFNPLIK